MFENRKHGAVHVVSGDACLNVEAVDELHALFADCAAQGQPRIVFDMQNVPLIDSCGLGLLVTTHRQCRLRGGCLRLAGPNQLCRDILDVTGVADRLQIYDDVLTAVGSFAV
jgi:anti-anti-sigma factor